ncbi:hypothetical protein [Agromyces sp. H66]|uniref:SCO7613 C-terminal domain-containing membrane protein n=1 Tax=Agromyces sp. H66 TaxID=2529859 RepID=UPI0010AAED0C|nr:hypothetical protein [Agromyces sp. H66]
MTLPTAPVSRGWSEAAVAYLLDATACPVCGRDRIRDGRCPTCGAHIDADLGSALLAASERAASAIRRRQEMIDRVPTAALDEASVPAKPAPETSPPGAPPSSRPPQPSPRTVPASSSAGSNATVQSVLAVTGAGLLAVAAVVFTYFNPDLTDHAVRSTIVAGITVVFLAGAWWLSRHGLAFSAEAVGGLGLVFGALDVSAIIDSSAGLANAWLTAAVATFVGGTGMAGLALAARVRIWLWGSLVALATVPAMLGAAGGTVATAVVGYLGAAGAASALVGFARWVSRRFDGRLVAEQGTLTAIQLIAVFSAIVPLPLLDAGSSTGFWLTVAGVFAAIAVLGTLSARHPAGRFWSALAGSTGIVAIAVLPLTGIGDVVTLFWATAVCTGAAAAGLAAMWAVAPRLPGIAVRAFTGGALAAASVPTAVLAFIAADLLLRTIVGTAVTSAVGGILADTGDAVAIATGLAAATIGFAAVAAISRRSSARAVPDAAAPAAPIAAPGAPARVSPAVALGTTAAWLGMLAWIVVACAPGLPLAAQIAIALGLALVAAASSALVPAARASSLVRGSFAGGAHGAVVVAAMLASSDPRMQPWAGIAVLIALAAIARAMPTTVRFLYVGAGFAYALSVVATVLGTTALEGIAQWCVTTAVGLLVAIVATFLPQVGPRTWWVILAVAAVPFGIGVVQVVFERSGWTALSTGLMLLLATALLVTRRPGLGIALRTSAAALIVPSAAVVAVCLGAELLAMSASPVVLPMIAVLVAGVLPAGDALRGALARHGLDPAAARAARIAIEWSAFATGAIAVLLSLVRTAAGLETMLVVLVLLGLGAAAMAVVQRRRLGWWLAAASFTGALWSVWGLVGVHTIEAYLVPPGLGAALVGGLLTARGARAVPLVASGLLIAVLPSLGAMVGSDSSASTARSAGLLAAAWLLVVVGSLVGRGTSKLAERLRALRPAAFAVAIITGAAGAVQGVRFGMGQDVAPLADSPLVLVCAGVGAIGGTAAALGARGLIANAADGSALARSRWLAAPALVYVTAAAWPAIRTEWPEIWSMWALMLGALAFMLLAAVRSVAGRTNLPPVWFAFAIAFVTAVVAWSPRELRVEWFSLPLGLFLLAAGTVALWRGYAGFDGARTLTGWPGGWRGSWSLLAPGLVVLFSASITATFTDPQTWRAILVILFALAAILVGSVRRLAAPFLSGIIVLPIENVVVFAVQIGRGIQSMPWWITLAVVGAVLLIIAVTSERRAGADLGIAARLRDLR